MTRSIETVIEEITGLNMKFSDEQVQHENAKESLYHEVKSKMEEAVSSFLVFLPHLKNQIDFAHAQGEDFDGHIYYARGDEGKFSLSAYGSKSESSLFPWKNRYHLRIYFGFSERRKLRIVGKDYPSVHFSIPANPEKETKTEVTLYQKKEDHFMKVQLMQLVDVVLEGYREASASGMEVFSQNFDHYSKDKVQYKILLPYVISAIPDLTVNAASCLTRSITTKKEATSRNNTKISELKTPDLEEAIGLLTPKK